MVLKGLIRPVAPSPPLNILGQRVSPPQSCPSRWGITGPFNTTRPFNSKFSLISSRTGLLSGGRVMKYCGPDVFIC